MELIILRNGSDVIARTNDFTDGATYSILQVEELPAYPTEEPGFCKSWDLKYVDGVVVWEKVDRPLTPEEQLQDAINALNIVGVK